MAYHIKYFPKMNVLFLYELLTHVVYIHKDHQSFDTWPCIFQDTQYSPTFFEDTLSWVIFGRQRMVSDI